MCSIHHYVSVITCCGAHLVTVCLFVPFSLDDQYNIPEITECPEVGEALKHIDAARKKELTGLPPLVRRLVRDASICFYASSNADMY